MSNKRPTVEAKCEVCNNTYQVIRSKFLKGLAKVCSKSCRGIKARSCLPKNFGRTPTHGACVDGKLKRTYRIWGGMKARCFRKTSHLYSRYGGVGITMCDNWKNSYAEFEKWALANGYDENLQCDRIDNKKGYYPENCRWVTPEQNCANRGNSVLMLNGETTKTVAKRLGLTQAALRYRLKVMKLSLEQASNMPKLYGSECKCFKRPSENGAND